MPELKRELTSPACEPGTCLSDLEERNRQLEETLAETKQKLATAVDQLSWEIRERVAINRSLESALENFRNVLEKGSSGVIIVDQQGATRYVNPMAAQMLKWERSDMVGQVFGVPVAEGDVELEILKGDGSKAIALMRIIPTIWEGEDAQMIVLRDVTTEKAQELEVLRLNRALGALYRCSEIIVRVEDERLLLKGICQSMVEMGGYAAAWIGLCPEGRPADLVRAAEASQGKRLSLKRNDIVCPHVKEVLRTGRLFVSADTEDGPCEVMMRMGCKSTVSVPLSWRNGTVGVLTLYSREHRAFSQEELQLLNRLADDISHAVAALRSRAERARAQERLQRLSMRLVQLQEDERRNIARELHDEIGQVLTGLKMTIDRSSQKCRTCESNLAEASQGVSQLIQRIRDLSRSLRPTMLDDLGLLPTLKWHFDRYTNQTGLEVDFRYGELPAVLPHEVVIIAYRVVQEALTNAARYSGVHEVMVRLQRVGSCLRVEVKDEGVGFDLGALPADGGVGISGMRERVISIGGTLGIETSPGCGTRILAELPLRRGSTRSRRKKA